MKKFVAFSFVVALLIGAQAEASSVSISPTALRAKDSTSSQTLTLTNKSGSPVSYQVQIYAWSQVAGRDVLVLTNEVVASPRIVEIAPNAKQVIRIIKPVPAVGKTSYYRAFARELPPLIKPTKSGITGPIYHNLPVSYEPVNASAPALALKRQGSELAVTNTGGTAARLSRVATTDGTVLAEGALGWSLPGSMKLVPIKTFGGSQVVLTVNGKPQTLSVE